MVKLELGKENLAKEVAFIVNEGILKCSCQLYETEGIPCRRILFVIRLEDIEYLPADHLIMKRWTTDVISEVVFDSNGINLCSNRENMHPP